MQTVLGVEKEELFRKKSFYGTDDTLEFGDVETTAAEDPMELDVDTSEMNTVDLCERIEFLESLLMAEKSMNESYAYSQQVIIDHLAEFNEGLLQFFRVKFKLLDKRGKTLE